MARMLAAALTVLYLCSPVCAITTESNPTTASEKSAYLTNEELYDMMRSRAAQYPDRAYVYSIGKPGMYAVTPDIVACSGAGLCTLNVEILVTWEHESVPGKL